MIRRLFDKFQPSTKLQAVVWKTDHDSMKLLIIKGKEKLGEELRAPLQEGVKPGDVFTLKTEGDEIIWENLVKDERASNSVLFLNLELARQICANNEKAVLLDVRSSAEYRTGHLPNAVLASVELMPENIIENFKDKKTPLFLYCQSGARSRMAVGLLKRMGYPLVFDAGGISSYRGPIEN